MADEVHDAQAAVGGGQQSHLVVIIHGIGKHGEEKRRHYLQVLDENMKELRKEESKRAITQSNIDFRFTEWHDIPEMTQKRSGFNYLSMPKGAKLLKGVMKDVVSDFLFYAEAKHREKIIQSVVLQINHLHEEFCTRNAEASHGNLHILAHSLGSVIAYDILSSHFKLPNSEVAGPPVKLNVDPKNLFICGSPLGLILSVRDERCEIGRNKECCLGDTRCWNVMHPVDPLAYRVEPLVYRAQPSLLAAASGGGGEVKDAYWLQTMPPVQVDYWKGRRHRHKSFGEKAKSAKEMAKSALTSLVPHRFRRRSTAALERQDSPTEDPDVSPDSGGSGRPPSWSIAAPEMSRRKSYMSDEGVDEDMQDAAVLHPSGLENRIDFRLQRTFSESLVNLVTLVQSHRAYWFSKDFMLFITDKIVDPNNILDPRTPSTPGQQWEDDGQDDSCQTFEDDNIIDDTE